MAGFCSVATPVPGLLRPVAWRVISIGPGSEPGAVGDVEGEIRTGFTDGDSLIWTDVAGTSVLVRLALPKAVGLVIPSRVVMKEMPNCNGGCDWDSGCGFGFDGEEAGAEDDSSVARVQVMSLGDSGVGVSS